MFLHAIDIESRSKYLLKANERKRFGAYRWEEILMGKSPAFSRAQHRRFVSKDGTAKQNEEECTMLLTASARLSNGVFQS